MTGIGVLVFCYYDRLIMYVGGMHSDLVSACSNRDSEGLRDWCIFYYDSFIMNIGGMCTRKVEDVYRQIDIHVYTDYGYLGKTKYGIRDN